MSNLVEYVKIFSGLLSGESISPALPERMRILQSALFETETVATPRTLAAPHYETDLGVRNSTDAFEFYRYHAQLVSYPLLNDEEIFVFLRQKDILRLANFIDSFNLFFGCTDVLRKVILSRENEVKNSSDYSLQIASGVLLGQVGKQQSLKMFDYAASSAKSGSEIYGALHRKAVVLTKRLHNLSSAEKTLDDAYIKYLNNDNPELEAERALYHNLLALLFQMKGSSVTASVELKEAVKCLDRVQDSAYLNSNIKNKANRYRAQVYINMAQLNVSDKNYSRAEKILRESVEFCAKFSPEYVSESLGELAIIYFLLRDYDGCISYACAALNQLRYIGAVSAIKAVRKVLIASLMKQNRREYALEVARNFQLDPIGIQYVNLN